MDNWFFYEVSFALFVTGSLRPTFGKLQDRLGFKRNFVWVLICLILFCCTVFFTWKHWESYFLYNFAFYFLTAFMSTLENAVVSKIFGLHSGGRILGFLRATAFLAGMFIFITKTTLLNPKILEKWTMFLTCALFYLICLLSLFFLNSRPIIKEKNLLDTFEREKLI